MIRTTLVLGFLLVSAATAHAVTLVAVNRAAAVTAVAPPSDTTGSLFAINDQVFPDQYDSGNGATSAVAVKFGSEQSFNKMFLYMTSGYVVPDFQVQVANTGVVNPDVNNNSDWHTIPGGNFTSQPNAGPGVYTFSQDIFSSGVRIYATDKTNPAADNRMRVRELQVFDRYDNVAPLATATYSGPALAGTASQLTNELISDQVFFNQNLGPGLFDFTWATPQSIGGFMTVGGAGAPSEHLIDYKIQADLGSGLVDIFTHTGNTFKTVYDILPGAPISTTHVRLIVTKGDGGVGDVVRVSEFYMFVPEPSAGLLLGSGICAMVVARRRRQRI